MDHQSLKFYFNTFAYSASTFEPIPMKCFPSKHRTFYDYSSDEHFPFRYSLFARFVLSALYSCTCSLLISAKSAMHSLDLMPDDVFSKTSCLRTSLHTAHPIHLLFSQALLELETDIAHGFNQSSSSLAGIGNVSSEMIFLSSCLTGTMDGTDTVAQRFLA